MTGFRPELEGAPLSLGIVGAGLISRTVHLPVVLAIPDVRVAWIADRSLDAARATVASFRLAADAVSGNPDELPGCDVALLATPVGARDGYHRALGARGTAVLSEKPFATGRADHLRWAQAYAEHRIGCGYMRRTYEGLRLLRDATASGVFGSPREVVIRDGGRSGSTGSDRPFLEDRATAGGGALMDYGSHAVDTCLFVVGATGASVLDAGMVLDGAIDREVTARAQLDTPVGPVLMDLKVSWLERQANTVEVVFERGRLRAGLGPAGEVEVVAGDGGALARLAVAARGPRTPYQAFFAEWRAFLDGVRSGRPSIVSAASALATTALVEDLYARAGRSPA